MHAASETFSPTRTRPEGGKRQARRRVALEREGEEELAVLRLGAAGREGDAAAEL